MAEQTPQQQVAFNKNVESADAAAAIVEGRRWLDPARVAEDGIEVLPGGAAADAWIKLDDGTVLRRRFTSQAETEARAWLAQWTRQNLRRA